MAGEETKIIYTGRWSIRNQELIKTIGVLCFSSNLGKITLLFSSLTLISLKSLCITPIERVYYQYLRDFTSIHSFSKFLRANNEVKERNMDQYLLQASQGNKNVYQLVRNVFWFTESNSKKVHCSEMCKHRQLIIMNVEHCCYGAVPSLWENTFAFGEQ